MFFIREGAEMSSTPLLQGSRAVSPSSVSRNRVAIIVSIGLFVVATELISVLTGSEGMLLKQARCLLIYIAKHVSTTMLIKFVRLYI